MSTETVRAYIEALSAHDVPAAVAMWRPGGVDRVPGSLELVAPDDITGYLTALFAAFPDWRQELVETVTQRERCVARWRAQATFAGPGRMDGIIANGESIEIEGVDVMTVRDGQIVANTAFGDRAEMLGQLGILPAPGSRAGRTRTAATNVRHRVGRLSAGRPQVIAPGVWLLRAYAPSAMNVYFLAEPDGGVTVFDAGVAQMRRAIAATAAQLGGLRRVVLGHADCDHRGGAAGLDAPIHCHALEAEAAASAAHRRPYWDLSRLSATSRPIFPALFALWDGGPLEVAGTLAEGDQVAGFEVIELPGHAPGLIGLFREEDGLVLCSDLIYTLDPETGLPGRARLPHAAFNHDSDQARASVRKLAQRAPRVVWPGHSHPVAGPQVVEQLLRVAEA